MNNTAQKTVFTSKATHTGNARRVSIVAGQGGMLIPLP